MDTSETPQWGQEQTAAEQLLRQMAADTGASPERDALGRLVLVHPHP